MCDLSGATSYLNSVLSVKKMRGLDIKDEVDGLVGKRIYAIAIEC
jgi:hypothetical protein